jgi:Flp pilus assembly protein TadD
VLKQKGDLQPAADALREAIRLQPDFPGAHTNLGAVLRQLGDENGAAAESRAGMEILKHMSNESAATFATNSGRRLLNVGDLEGAISQFRSAIQSLPAFAPAHYQLALALQRKGNSEEAASEFRKAAELDPRWKAPSQ